MTYFFCFIICQGSTRDVVSYVLDYDFVVSEFELQSHYYAHFQTNALGKGMNSLIHQLWLINTPTVLL